jgi:colicin import membrane protein
MTEETALIPIDEINLDLAYSNRKSIDAVLAKLKVAAEAHVPDTSTEAGRKAIASNSYKVSRCKTWMVSHAKKMTEDWRKKTKTVNTLRNHVETFCDDLRDRTREPLTKIEEAEKAEREARRKELEMLADWDEALEHNALVDREREVARKEAELAAAEAARLEKERAEKEEQERKEREARIKAEAEERAKREAAEAIERAEAAKREAVYIARMAKERAERDRLKAIEDAKAEKKAAIERERQRAQEESDRRERDRLAAEAEKKRIAEEEKEKAERLARHHAHRAKVRKEAIQALITVGNFDDEEAERVFEIIDAGKVPNITVNY